MGILPNAKHEAFAQALAKGMTQEAAYAEAGYKPHRSNASALSANHNISARVAELMEPAVQETQIEASRILQEFARIGLSDIRSLFTPEGELRSIHDLDDVTAAAVASVEVVTKAGPPDENGNRTVEHLHKIKFWDKNAALDKLAKHLAIYAADKAADSTAQSLSGLLEVFAKARPTPIATAKGSE
jgi:phage terminase small subunit